MSELESAYVLHRRAYQESSLLIECFTRNQGRLQAIAKGGRRFNSRWRPLLHPFTPLLIQTRGKGRVLTLVNAEPQGSAYQLAGVSLACGFYVNELIIKLMHAYDPHIDLFEVYERTLWALNSEAWAEPPLRRFEKRLLAELGYGINFQADHYGRALRSDFYYYYDRTEGAFVPVDVSEGYFSGSDLLALKGEQFDSLRICRTARQLLRPLIDELLDGETIWSRQLLQPASPNATR